MGISYVYGARKILIRDHHAQNRFHQIVHELERTGLFSLAIERDILSLQSLDNEIRDDTSVPHGHAGPVGVENPDDFRGDACCRK